MSALHEKFEIRLATSEEIPLVKALLERYHTKNLQTGKERANGFVTTDMTERQLETLLIVENGVAVAFERSTGTLAGLLLGASWQFLSDWPMFVHMAGLLPEHRHEGKKLSPENCYQYGPICIAEEYRGEGVGEALADLQRKVFGERYPISATFVNLKNQRSLSFHERYGWKHAGEFSFNGNGYYLLTIDTL